MELLHRWKMAIHLFVLDLIRLQHPLSVLYLMTVNFLFCFIAFYASTEVQLWSLYSLIGSIFCINFIFVRHRCNLALGLLKWIFNDFLEALAIAFCAFSANGLHEGNEKKAFFGSLLAVSAVIASPVYSHYRINSKIVDFLGRLKLWLKQFCANYIIYPASLCWEWLEYILLFRWLPVIGSQLRVCFLSAWDWIDAHLFHPLRVLRRKIGALFVYVVYFHWCADLWAFARWAIIDPACVRLSRLLDAFIYVFGCYWLKPLLKRMGSAFLSTVKSGLCILGQATYALSALFYEHIMCPLLILFVDRLEQFSVYLFRIAIRPFLAVCYRKYKLVEDLALIYILGPVFKKLLNIVPERNPFDHDSDHDLDGFIPKEGNSDETFINNSGEELTETGEGEADSAMHSDADEDNLSSRHSFDDEKSFASGLKKIAISETDSEVDEFLPVRKTKRKRRENCQAAIDS